MFVASDSPLALDDDVACCAEGAGPCDGREASGRTGGPCEAIDSGSSTACGVSDAGAFSRLSDSDLKAFEAAVRGWFPQCEGDVGLGDKVRNDKGIGKAAVRDVFQQREGAADFGEKVRKKKGIGQAMLTGEQIFIKSKVGTLRVVSGRLAVLVSVVSREGNLWDCLAVLCGPVCCTHFAHHRCSKVGKRK